MIRDLTLFRKLMADRYVIYYLLVIMINHYDFDKFGRQKTKNISYIMKNL